MPETYFFINMLPVYTIININLISELGKKKT